MVSRTPSKRIASQAPRSVSRPPPSAAAIRVVGIGASAGGLEAFTDLVSNIPADTGLAFVLVQDAIQGAHGPAAGHAPARLTDDALQQVPDALRFAHGLRCH